MKWAESRLEGFVEVIGLEMGMELGGGFGEGFGEEREVGDGAVVGEVGWVQGGLFEDGGDGGEFVGSGKVTKG